jgi:hypothetical protein
MRVLFLVVFVLMISQGIIFADDLMTEKAKEVFELMVERSRDFDKSVSELYSDDAIITNIRHYPFGKSREMQMDGKTWKFMIRSTMWLAKMRKDISTFSNVNYEISDDGVLVTATRYSKLKKYSSPYAAFIKDDGTGNWCIFKEVTESKP